jgi:hypothetical protein
MWVPYSGSTSWEGTHKGCPYSGFLRELRVSVVKDFLRESG